MPAITNVYTGSNGTLTLASDDTPEGQDAKKVIDFWELQTVGRVTGVELHVQTDLEEFHMIGQRHPVSLHAGNIHISGRITRAYINGALLQLLMGRGASRTTFAEPYVLPAFNMVLSMNDPSFPNNTARLEIGGVKLQDWHYAMPEQDFVMENVTFRALSIHVTDQGATGGATSPTALNPSFGDSANA